MPKKLSTKKQTMYHNIHRLFLDNFNKSKFTFALEITTVYIYIYIQI